MSEDDDEIFWGVETEKEVKVKIKNCPRRTTILAPWANANISPYVGQDLDEKTKFLEDSFGNLCLSDSNVPDSPQHFNCSPKVTSELPMKFTSIKTLSVDHKDRELLDIRCGVVYENSAILSTETTSLYYETAPEEQLSNTDCNHEINESPMKFTSVKTLIVDAADVKLLDIFGEAVRENSTILSSTSTSPNYETGRESQTSNTDYFSDIKQSPTSLMSIKTISLNTKDAQIIGICSGAVSENSANFSSQSTSPNYETARESQISSSDFSFKSTNITLRKCKTPLKEANSEKIPDFEENGLRNSSNGFRLSTSEFSTFSAESKLSEDELNIVSSSEFNSKSSVNEVDSTSVMLSSDSCLFPEEDEGGDDDESKENKECQTSFWYIPLPKKSEQITQQMKTNVSNVDAIATATADTVVTSFKPPLFKTPQNPKKINEFKTFTSERKCKRALIPPKPVVRSKTFTKYNVESPVAKYIKRQVPPLISNVRSKSIGQMHNMKRVPNTTPSKIPRLVHCVSNPTIYRHPKPEL